MHHFWGYEWGPWAGIMMIFMLLFWIAILVGIFFLIRYLIQQTRPESTATSEADPAMRALRERFAKGEISREEFEERKQALG